MDTQQLLASPVQHKVSWSPHDMRSRLRSPLKIPGGKWYLSESILQVCAPAMAATDTWNEHTAGGANTSLQATPRKGVLQVLADIDPLTANVWRVFTTEPLALQLVGRLQSISVVDRSAMEAEFVAATQVLAAMGDGWDFESLSPEWRVGLAAATIINSRMSRGGMGKNFAWQDRNRGGQPGEINSWKTFVTDHAPRVIQRCRNMVALNMDALTLGDPDNAGMNGGVMNPRHFYYYDPPYPKETRTAKDVYRCDDFPHERFIYLVMDGKAKIAISSYANPLYDEALTYMRGWVRHDFSIPNHSGQGKVKQGRIESLYSNF